MMYTDSRIDVGDDGLGYRIIMAHGWQVRWVKYGIAVWWWMRIMNFSWMMDNHNAVHWYLIVVYMKVKLVVLINEYDAHHRMI